MNPGKDIFIEVVLPLAIPRTYTYAVPADISEQIATGKRVVVQFGKKRFYTALVWEIHNRTPDGYTPQTDRISH